jgi:hypothetical protein
MTDNIEEGDKMLIKRAKFPKITSTSKKYSTYDWIMYMIENKIKNRRKKIFPLIKKRRKR